ncbi:restriction endonuclease [Embleya scabrispora]|uniref:restriction endonuclease n=1 Tax=Embleya scabrispora TaxID=159449 RepID=UPI00131A076B|nr:restriction endonuclease [Embleya scabrispora]MYS87905.1 hypothetical protein [Streptomyces sp. SID5474]
MSVAELVAALGMGSTADKSVLGPEFQLVKALKDDQRRRAARGLRVRFGLVGRSVSLRPPGNEVETAIEKWNSEVKLDLLEQLHACDPFIFEQIVAKLLVSIGYEDVQVTSPSRDGGIDVEAVHTGGVVRVKTAVQVKRWRKKKVGRPEVQQLRGAMSVAGLGVLVTTGGFTTDAIEDARREGAIPVELIDGTKLVDLMVEHGLGVSTTTTVLFAVDEKLLAGSTDVSSAPVAVADGRPSAVQGEFNLAQLPEGRNGDYCDTLFTMVQLAESQPSLRDYIAAFQGRFAKITRVDEARRRMRVLVALGLAEIESDHVSLTLVGRRFLDGCDVRLLQEAFMGRIAGAEEIRALVEGIPSKAARQRRVEERRPEGMTSTQARLVLRWLTQLELIR